MKLWEQGLRQIKATINLCEYKISYLKPFFSQKINYTNDNQNYEKENDNIMIKNNNIFKYLPFTTTIEAKIKKINDEPIYTKQYPYPMADKKHKEFWNLKVREIWT